MRNTRTLGSILLDAFVLLAAVVFNLPVKAQNPELQQRLAEVKQSMAQNKQALAQYTWVDQVTISLKGEQKKQENFQVRVGPDGKQQKTSLDPPANAQPEGRVKCPMFVQNDPVWDHLCKIVQPLFRVEHPENDHHNECFPTSLFDATSKKSAAFFVQVDYFALPFH